MSHLIPHIPPDCCAILVRDLVIGDVVCAGGRDWHVERVSTFQAHNTASRTEIVAAASDTWSLPPDAILVVRQPQAVEAEQTDTAPETGNSFRDACLAYHAATTDLSGILLAGLKGSDLDSLLNLVMRRVRELRAASRP